MELGNYLLAPRVRRFLSPRTESGPEGRAWSEHRASGTQQPRGEEVALGERGRPHRSSRLP